MTRRDVDWEELGTVWRATTLDKEALALQLDKRLKRQARYRRLEISCEIFITIASAFAGVILWLNLEDEGRWRQIAMVGLLFGLVTASWAISLWMRRGTGGEAQSLTAMIDLAIARGESRRRRVLAAALGGLLGILLGTAFWLLHPDHVFAGLAFILGWCSVFAIGLTGWEYVKWRREQKYLAQFREMKEMLREEP